MICDCHFTDFRADPETVSVCRIAFTEILMLHHVSASLLRTFYNQANKARHINLTLAGGLCLTFWRL